MSALFVTKSHGVARRGNHNRMESLSPLSSECVASLQSARDTRPCWRTRRLSQGRSCTTIVRVYAIERQSSVRANHPCLLLSVRAWRDIPRPDDVLLSKIIDHDVVGEDLRTKGRRAQSSLAVEIDQDWTSLESLEDQLFHEQRTRRTSSIDWVLNASFRASSTVPRRNAGERWEFSWKYRLNCSPICDGSSPSSMTLKQSREQQSMNVFFCRSTNRRWIICTEQVRVTHLDGCPRKGGLVQVSLIRHFYSPFSWSNGEKRVLPLSIESKH